MGGHVFRCFLMEGLHRRRHSETGQKLSLGLSGPNSSGQQAQSETGEILKSGTPPPSPGAAKTVFTRPLQTTFAVSRYSGKDKKKKNWEKKSDCTESFLKGFKTPPAPLSRSAPFFFLEVPFLDACCVPLLLSSPTFLPPASRPFGGGGRPSRRLSLCVYVQSKPRSKPDQVNAGVVSAASSSEMVGSKGFRLFLKLVCLSDSDVCIFVQRSLPWASWAK